MLPFAEKRAAAEKAFLEAGRTYHRACSQADGGNPLDALHEMIDAALEYGRFEAAHAAYVATPRVAAPSPLLARSCDDAPNNLVELRPRRRAPGERP